MHNSANNVRPGRVVYFETYCLGRPVGALRAVVVNYQGSGDMLNLIVTGAVGDTSVEPGRRLRIRAGLSFLQFAAASHVLMWGWDADDFRTYGQRMALREL